MKTKMFQSAVVLVGFILSSISAFADPLNHWHWRNPMPNGNPGYFLYGIVFTNGQFFSVGANGMEVTSPDGTNWTQWATATTNQLNDIIYGNGQFMAVGTNGAVETSVNGTNWVLQNSGTSASLSSVAYGNGGYVAVGGSAIIASPDGVTWSPATSGPGGATSVASSSSGFVAINGGATDYFSQNGLTWTANTLTGPGGGGFGGGSLSASVLTCNQGTFCIAASQIASSGTWYLYVFASSDGQNWTTNFTGNEGPYLAPFYYSVFMSGNGKTIAGGYCNDGQFLLSSSNNVNWSFNTPVPSSNPFNNAVGNAGTYGNGVYVLVNSTLTMYTSTNGVNWATTPPNILNSQTSTFNSITYSNGTYVVATSNLLVVSEGSGFVAETNTPSMDSVIVYSNTFVAVGPSGDICTSTNGLVWTSYNLVKNASLHCVAAGKGLLVAVADSGEIETSPSGTNWTKVSSGTSQALYGVTYSDGIYVAVGQGGTVVTSPDGVTWTVRSSGQLNNLLAVTYGSAGFLAVGASGTMLTSPDGVNWTQQNSGTSAAFESATFGNGYYLVDGPNALVMTSPDGVNWTSRNIGATGNPTLYGSAFLNGRFDVVGSGGTVIESDPVAPLLDLQSHGKPPHNTFTFFATQGSTFRLVSSPNLVGGAWSTVATFNNAAAITLWTNSAVGGNPTYFRLASP